MKTILERLMNLSKKLSGFPETTYWLCVVPMIFIACTVAMWPVLGAPHDLFPTGVDTVGHLTKVEQLAANWSRLSFADWFPQWYMGATFVQYYAPLSFWLGSLIQLLTGNIMLTFKLFAFACLFLGGIFTSGLAKKFGADPAAGATSGVLYALGFSSLYIVFIDGTLGRALTLPLFPLLLGQMVSLYS
ncbi:MAG: 6-pyruvoyl-tetrahydropterin synthase-related protein [Bacillota bacterium]|nr:6-pyruvoyl-tetrahydropterin synthase-related protein [Bacillota bacterium]